MITFLNTCNNIAGWSFLRALPKGGERAKKVVSDSPGVVDFAIGLVNSVFNLPDGQVNFFEEFKLQENCELNLLIKTFLGLVEMTFGLVKPHLNGRKFLARLG